MTHLLITNKRDITSDFIVAEMNHRNMDVTRWNTEDICDYKLTIFPNENRFKLSHVDFTLDSDDIDSAYYRRPGPPEIPEYITDRNERIHCSLQWDATLKGAYEIIDRCFLNSPSAIATAESKVRQLLAARRIGFRVPDTIVSNCPNQIRQLGKNNHTVSKCISRSLIEGNNERVIFTEITPNITDENNKEIEASPFITQSLVKKTYDIRATVVGHRVFAARIHSQDDPETQIDWRKGTNVSMKQELIELDQKTERMCIDLVQQLNLTFGAIDLILDEKGEIWFLECNPNGQWAWIEHRTGANVSAAIVDALIQKSKENKI